MNSTSDYSPLTDAETLMAASYAIITCADNLVTTITAPATF
jgi:hypothetical protein